MSDLTDQFKFEMSREILFNEATLMAHYREYQEEGNIEARNACAVLLAPLTFSTLKGLEVEEEYLDDVIQAGNEAILKSLVSWQPKKGGWSLTNWCARATRRDMVRELERLRGDEEMVSMEEVIRQLDLFPEESGVTRSVQEHDLQHFIQECRGADEVTRQWLWAELEKEDWTVRNLFELVLHSGHSVRNAGWILGMSQSAADRLFQKVISRLRVTCQ